MREIETNDGQNQVFRLNSHRNLAAKNSAMAQNHAARPFPGRPKCLNTRNRGNVRNTAATTQGNVTLVSDFSIMHVSPNTPADGPALLAVPKYHKPGCSTLPSSGSEGGAQFDWHHHRRRAAARKAIEQNGAGVRRIGFPVSKAGAGSWPSRGI